MPERRYVGLAAISRAMGINAYRAKMLMDRGDIEREKTDHGSVVTQSALDAWLATDAAAVERAVERAGRP